MTVLPPVSGQLVLHVTTKASHLYFLHCAERCTYPSPFSFLFPSSSTILLFSFSMFLFPPPQFYYFPSSMFLFPPWRLQITMHEGEQQ